MLLHVLVVDDDVGILELLDTYLRSHGYIVSKAADVAAARSLLGDFIFDLLILDVMLPDQSGIQFLAQIRDQFTQPVIILTALGDVDDRINGLSTGANDYLAKPFEPEELLLRIKNLLSYAAINAPHYKEQQLCRFGDFCYDKRRCLLMDQNGDKVNLTSNEQQLLHTLLQQVGKVISREELLLLFSNTSVRAVDTMITRLRSKIEKDSKNPEHLQTVRNRGYVFRC